MSDGRIPACQKINDAGRTSGGQALADTGADRGDVTCLEAEAERPEKWRGAFDRV